MAKIDDALIRHLAAGSTVESAARRAGVSRATAHRRLTDPAFRQRVEETRAELWKRAMSVLSKASVESAAVLRRLLRSADEKTRMQTAKIVLEQGSKLRDQIELAQRLAAIEENLNARKGQGNPP